MKVAQRHILRILACLCMAYVLVALAACAPAGGSTARPAETTGQTQAPANGSGTDASSSQVAASSFIALEEPDVSSSAQQQLAGSSEASDEQSASESTDQMADNAGTQDAADYPAPGDLPVEAVVSQEQLAAEGENAFFTVQEIPDAVFARMEGVTYPADCPVAREDLRFIRLLHMDADGNTKVGEMVANVAIAQELCDLFCDLYHKGYAIERVRLADDYGGSDEESMRDNNTSCFNCRPIEGSGAQSRHSYGMAVDINPLYNPYVSTTLGVLPETAGPWVDRSVTTPYTIDPADDCCQAFALKGYYWGGDWTEPKDYQHFER